VTAFVVSDLSEAERRRLLSQAAHELLLLVERCPELFVHVVPIDARDMQTLHELAYDFDEEDDNDGAE
jgi:hypothetical protein